MNCYVCDDKGKTTPAVSICQHCGVALCRTHLDEDLLLTRPHGMMRRGCLHQPVHNALEGPTRPKSEFMAIRG